MDSRQTLEDNLACLQVSPGDVARLRAADPAKCRLEMGEADQPQLFLEGQAVYSGSRPVESAAAEAQGLLAEKTPGVVVFFGLGLGLHADFLRRLTDAPLVIHEPSADLAAFTLAHVAFDLPDVHLTTDPETLADLLGSLVVPGKEVVVGALPFSRQAFPGDFDAFREAITACLNDLKVQQATRQTMSAAWVANLASNLPALGQLKSSDGLKGPFQGRPAIFVGAGPSLDLNLEALAQAKGRALIVAAHTAVIPLARAGIVPDLVLIIEGQKLDHFFTGVEHLDEMVLLASPLTHPLHLQLGFKEVMVLPVADNAAADWLGRAYGDDPLAVGGSVACSAFALMHAMGCDPLVCVGMDLSYSLGRSHALGTDLGCCEATTDEQAGLTSTHCREGYHRDLQYSTTMVTAWGGTDQVATRRHLASFRHWFEQAARQWLSGHTLINANGAGSRIRGFQEMGLAQVQAEFTQEGPPIGALLEEAISRVAPREPAALAHEVQSELKVIGEAGAAAEKADRQAQTTIKTLRRGQLQRVQPQLDEVARHETALQALTRRTRLLNTLVGHRARDLAAEKTSGGEVARTIVSLEQSRRISRLVIDGASELAALFGPALQALEQGQWPWKDPRLTTGVLAIVGTGNFATNLAALVESFGLEVRFFVDEFRTGSFQGQPVFAASQLGQAPTDGVDKWVLAISNPAHRNAAVERLRSHGVDKLRILPLQDDTDLQILRLLFEKEQAAALNRFCAAGVTRLAQLEEKFLGTAIPQVMGDLDPDQRTIGLGYFGRGGGFRGHISGLMPHLAPRFNVVTMSDEIMEGKDEAPHHLYLSADRACRLKGLDLILSAHVFPCAPRQVPRVSFSHVIYDFNLSAEYHAHRIAHSDTHYLFASSKPCFDWYASLVERFALKNRVCVVPGGYLQLDRHLAASEAHGGDRRAILYAPTLSLADYPHCELATSIDQGPEILEALLAAFPDREVIYRPHPSDLRLYQMERQDPRTEPFGRMLDICRDHPRGVLDDNPTSYLDSYLKAALLVSDTSSTAFTFALSTGRPVVFFSPRDEELVAELGDTLKFVGDREKVGKVVRTVEALTGAAGALLNADWAEDLARFRQEMIFHPGGAAAYFTDHVDIMLAGEKHPDWLSFNW